MLERIQTHVIPGSMSHNRSKDLYRAHRKHMGVTSLGCKLYPKVFDVPHLLTQNIKLPS